MDDTLTAAADPAVAVASPPEPPLKRLWSNLGAKNKAFTIPYDEFAADMQDEDNLRSLHKNLPSFFKGFAVPYDEFAADMGFKKKDLPALPTGLEPVDAGTPTPGTGSTAELTSPDPAADAEFASVPPPTPLGYDMARGLNAAPVAPLPPFGYRSTGAGGDLIGDGQIPHQPAAQGIGSDGGSEQDYLGQLPGLANKDYPSAGKTGKENYRGRGFDVEAGNELVEVPSDYRGGLLPGTFPDPNTGQQYFRRPLSNKVDGKVQTLADAMGGAFKNSIYEIGQGAGNAAQALTNVATLPNRAVYNAVGKLMGRTDEAPVATFGDTLEGHIENHKTKLAPLYTQDHNNLNTLAVGAASMAPMVVSQAIQLAVPEIKAAALLKSVIGYGSMIAFDVQQGHGAHERAKAAGLKGVDADYYTAFDWALTLAGFKVGGKLLGQLGDAAAMKIAPDAFRADVATGATALAAQQSAALGRALTRAEQSAVLGEVLKAKLPTLLSLPKSMAEGAATFAGADVATKIGNQVGARALGGTPEEVTPGSLLGDLGKSATMGAITHGVSEGISAGANAIGRGLRDPQAPATEAAPPATYSVVRPDRQVQGRGLTLAGMSPDGKNAIMEGVDGQGNPVTQTVPRAWLRAEQPAEPAAAAPDAAGGAAVPPTETYSAVSPDGVVQIPAIERISMVYTEEGSGQEVARVVFRDAQGEEAFEVVPTAWLRPTPAEPAAPEITPEAVAPVATPATPLAPEPAPIAPEPAQASAAPEPAPALAPVELPAPAAPAVVDVTGQAPEPLPAVAPAQPATPPAAPEPAAPAAPKPAAVELAPPTPLEAAQAALDAYQALPAAERKDEKGAKARKPLMEAAKAAGLTVELKGDKAVLAKDGKAVRREWTPKEKRQQQMLVLLNGPYQAFVERHPARAGEVADAVRKEGMAVPEWLAKAEVVAKDVAQPVDSSKEPLPATEATTPATTKPTGKDKPANVVNTPIGSITTDEKRFQNRTELNEDIVKGIAERYDPNQMDPVVTWKDPKDGKTYLLAGHHRLEGAKRAGVKDIPARPFTGTEAEAVKYARELSNANRSMETPLDRAKIYREKREAGGSKAANLEAAKAAEGKNAQNIIDLSHLNPTGRAHTAYQQMLGAAESASTAATAHVAQMIGAVRRVFPELTNAHENELYDYLVTREKYGPPMKGGKKTGNTNSATGLIEAVRQVVAHPFKAFDPANPLNLAKLEAPKTTAQSEAAADLARLVTEGENLTKRLNELSARQAPTPEMKAVKAKRKTELTDAFMRNREAQNKQRELMAKADAAADQQMGLFDAPNPPAPAVVITFEGHSEAEVATLEPKLAALEARAESAATPEQTASIAAEATQLIQDETDPQARPAGSSAGIEAASRQPEPTGPAAQAGEPGAAAPADSGQPRPGEPVAGEDTSTLVNGYETKASLIARLTTSLTDFADGKAPDSVYKEGYGAGAFDGYSHTLRLEKDGTLGLYRGNKTYWADKPELSTAARAKKVGSYATPKEAIADIYQRHAKEREVWKQYDVKNGIYNPEWHDETVQFQNRPRFELGRFVENVPTEAAKKAVAALKHLVPTPVAPEAKPSLAVQNTAAKQEFTDGLAEFRAARKKGGSTAQSSLLGIPAFSAEESAAIKKMVGAALKLGAIKTKQIIARLRSMGLSDDDATDEQLKPLIKAAQDAQRTDEERAARAERKAATRAAKGGDKAPVRPTDAATTERRGGAETIENKTSLLPEISEWMTKRGTDRYTPKPLKETEADAAAFIKKHGIGAAYEMLTGTKATGLAKDVQTVLSQQVMVHYDGEARRLAADPNADPAEVEQTVERAVKVAEAYNTEGTEDARSMRARQQLQLYAPSVAVARLGNEVREVAAEQRKAMAPQVRRTAKKARKANGQALDAALDAPDVATAEAEADKPGSTRTSKTPADPPTWGSRNTLFKKGGAAEAVKALKKLGLLSAPPAELVHFVGFHMEAGARSFAEMSKRVVRDLGAKVKPLLKDAYEKAKAELIANGDSGQGFDGPDAVQAALNGELADNLADRIVELAKEPSPAGQINPAKQLLDTLTAKVAEKLPADPNRTKDARADLVAAIQNRGEYADVFEQSKAEVEDKIDALKVSDDDKQAMRDKLQGYYDEIIGQPYADRQFARAYEQAEDTVLGNHAGKNRGQQRTALALASDAAIARDRAALIDHLTEGLAPGSPEHTELADRAGQRFDAEIEDRQKAERIRKNVALGQPERANSEAELGPKEKAPAKKAMPMSQRLRDLLATRTTDERAAQALAGDAIREGLAARTPLPDDGSGVTKYPDKGPRTLRQIARDHLTDPVEVGRSLADAFVREAGLTGAQAKVYADAIEKEFAQQIKETQTKERQAAYSRKVKAGATPKEANTFADRVARLYRLAPVDEGDVLGLVAAEAKLPTLTKEDNTRLYKLADAITQAKGDNAKARAVHEFYIAVKSIKGLTGWEQVKSAMYANMLSGFGTQLKNVHSTGLNVALDLFYNTGWAGYLAVGHALRTKSLSPLSLAFLPGKGLFNRSGADRAFQMLYTGVRPPGFEGNYEEAGDLEVMARMPAATRLAHVRKAYAQMAKFAPRFLSANDLMWAGGAEQMWAYNIALTEAMKEGRRLPTDAIMKAVNEKLYDTSVVVADATAQAEAELGAAPAGGLALADYNGQVRQRVQELFEAGRDARIGKESRRAAAETTFNGPMEGFAGAIMKVIGNLSEIETGHGTQGLKGVVPFTRVVANVTNAFLNYTPVGMGRAIAGKIGLGKEGPNKFGHVRTYSPMERSIVAAKSITGMVVMLAAYQLFDSDELTGAGPSDAQQNRQWQARGNRPYMLKGYNYKEHPELFYPLAAVAALKDAQAYDGFDLENASSANKAIRMVLATLQATVNSLSLVNLQDFMNSLNDPGRGRNPGERVSRYVNRTGAAVATSIVVPFSGLLRGASRLGQQLAGSTKREATNPWDMTMQDVPWVRNTLPKVWDTLGNEVPVGANMPYVSVPLANDPTGATQKINDFLAANKLFVPDVNRWQTDMQVLTLKNGKLTREERQSYLRMTDAERKQFMTRRAGGVTAMDDEEWGQFYPERGRLIKKLLLRHMPMLKRYAKKGDRRLLNKTIQEYVKTATNAARKKIVFAEPDKQERPEAEPQN